MSEDICDSTLTTDVWPNQVAAASGISGPTPPLGILVPDPNVWRRSFGSVRRTTSLHVEELPFYTKDGFGGRRLFKQHWAVIFGRIEARRQLRPPRQLPNRDWGNGFGQMNSSPAQIIFTQENEFLIQDSELLP